jgi:hypothetical protein
MLSTTSLTITSAAVPFVFITAFLVLTSAIMVAAMATTSATAMSTAFVTL